MQPIFEALASPLRRKSLALLAPSESRAGNPVGRQLKRESKARARAPQPERTR